MINGTVGVGVSDAYTIIIEDQKIKICEIRLQTVPTAVTPGASASNPLYQGNTPTTTTFPKVLSS